MLTPDYYEKCTEQILFLYEQLENDIISDITRRIMKTGLVTESARHQIEMLQNAGLLYDDILSEISKRTDATNAHVKALFEDAGVRSVAFDNEIYKAVGLVPVDLRQSPAMRQTLEAGYRKTLGNMHNLTLTTATTAQNTYYSACNQAYMQVISGAFSYQEAIKKAVQKTAQDGAFVLYPSGHRDRVDVAVRRSVLTGIGQTCREIGVMNADEMGCDLMEISAHFGARPSHAEWQGQIVSRSGQKGYLTLDEIGYGTGDGFAGWNCRHDWFPYFEGYSKRNYNDDYLKSLNEKNIEYNGKKYSQYEISQIQRRYEREIRSAKREKVAFDTAVKEASDPELKAVMQDSLNYANSVVKDKQAKMRDFIQQTKQDRDYFREQNYADKNVRNSLTSTLNSGKINYKQFYSPLNKDNIDFYINAVIQTKKYNGNFSDITIHNFLECAKKEINNLPKNQKAEAKQIWNLLICNMQEPIKLIDYDKKFVIDMSKMVVNNHKDDMNRYKNIRKIFVKALQEIPILNKYTIGVPFCGAVPYLDENGNQIINIGLNINNTIFKSSNNFIIILHEIGHYIDFKFVNYEKDTFSKILTYDFYNFEILNINLSKKEFNNMLDSFFNDAEQLSDIIAGVTKGKIKGKCSHNDSYWLDKDNLPAEAFAHFFEATIRNDKIKIQTYKKVFPNAYNTFLNYFNL